MPDTQTDVINEALTLIGSETIGDPSEPSEQARRAVIMFKTVIRAEIRSYNWNFARKKITLTSSPTPPPYEFSLTYQLPSDYLRLVTINDLYVWPVINEYVGSDLSPYTIEGLELQTNLTAPLKVKYIRDMTELISQWDAIFRYVASLKLAISITPTLVKNDTKYKLLYEEYRTVVKQARRVGAIELPSVPKADDSWLIGRLS
jgi:hypothetical protein